MSSALANNTSVADNSTKDTDDREYSRKAELLKLEDTGDRNNYAEFEVKSIMKLKNLDLWKYIEGPESVPPIIPILQEDQRIKVTDPDTNEEKEMILKGNAAAVKKAMDDSVPWQKGNAKTLSLIVDAVPGRKIYQ